jgi:alpha-1,3/alpha-1,6-mannosyltransferase
MRELEPDVFFIDQLSACIPLLRFLYPKAKILFYGHFPDRLLARSETGLVGAAKTIYRQPFDAIEAWSTSRADSIVVNSKFTRTVFKYAFGNTFRNRELKVVYPCVDTKDNSGDVAKEAVLWEGKAVLLSINRYERKKGLDLAVKAFAGLTAEERKKSKLIIAGGHDERVQENATTLHELEGLATELKLAHATYHGSDTDALQNDTDNEIIFLLSIPTDLKQRLLHRASILIYTPKNEHFGIVPLEAMLARTPVLATNTGGPLETIYDGRTGWLRSPEKIELWTEILRKPLIPSSADSLRTMGEKGRERVVTEFSHTRMAALLEEEMEKLIGSTGKRPQVMPDWLWVFAVLTVIAVVVGSVMGWFFMQIAVPKAVEFEKARNASSSAAVGTAAVGHEEL